MLGARQLLGVGPRPLVAVDLLDAHQAVGQARRGLEALGQAPAQVRPHHQPVDDHLDGVPLGLGQCRHVVDAVHLAVHRHAREALVADVVEHVTVLALAVAHHGGQHQEPCALGHGQHPVGDLLHALPGDLHPAHRAVRRADARIQHAQVVVDLGDGGHGRPRVAAGGLLVDRDGRRQAVDVVDVRLVHLPQELPGVRGEALHVPSLALGVQGVEGEARLAGARETRDDDQLIPWDLDADVLEVVLPGTDDAD